MKYKSGKRRPNLFRQATRRGPFLPLSLLILAILVLLFSLITPSAFFTNINPSNVRVPAFTPTPTALPRPTDVHGGHIVFTCTRKEINQICLINADGTGYQQLTNETTNGYYPAISPNGENIVFALNKYDYFDMYALVRGSSALTQLTAYVGNAFSPSFAPDGHQLVFVNRDTAGLFSLWVVGSSGENPHVLYAAPSNIVAAAWSPDGTTIAFAMAVSSQFAYEVFLLSVRDLKAAPRQISNGLGNIGGSIAWSKDGRNLLIFAGPVAAREVYRLDVATGASTRLTYGGNNAAAAYSPDGQYVVFNSLRNNGQADLYIMRADGHSMRQLTNNPEPDWQPQWGP
jgi:Tol biopolymer transport system component